jgi:flagellar basal-body rod modification protein FlgD
MASGVSTVGSASTTATDKKASTVGAAASMGKDDFMKLLVAQLQNQDPMKPMDDKEFITQLAQFSSLEAIEKMTTTLDDLAGSQVLAQSATLIGKQVTAKLADGTTVTGTVSQIRMVDHKPQVVVNDKEFDASLIITVGA